MFKFIHKMGYHLHNPFWIIIVTVLISSKGQSDHSHGHSHSSFHSSSGAENIESSHSFSLTDSESQGAIAEARAGESCRFPVSYYGSYFQSGVHHSITINRSSITSKGKCLEADGEKYLLYNERDSCYRCLVFHEKHANVLQYKETFCMPERRPLKHICSTITGDAMLFSMFRLDAKSIDCPFKGPYIFSYNRGHGECRSPMSTMNSCIHSSRLSFNYQACPDVESTESTVEEVQCLATWKEGSSRYLLGLIQYQHHEASYEDRFRCFVYEKSKRGEGNGSSGSFSQFHHSQLTQSRSHGHFPSNNTDHVFRVAQSGDATCQGVDATQSAMEGSRTMTLRRVHQPKSCQFPSWVQQHKQQWHTLNQESTFTFETHHLRVSNTSESSLPHSMGLTMTAVCSQIVENPTLDWVKFVMHATVGCLNGFMCISIYRRDGHIIELQMGNIARRAEDACQLSYFDQSHLPYITLVSSTIETRHCPNWGRFSVTGLSKEGRKINDKCIHGGFNTQLSVGCSSLDTFQFRSECGTPVETFSSQDYNCHGWWEEQGVSYLIAGTKSSLSSSHSSSHNHRHAKRSCFVFREKTTDPETAALETSRLHSQHQQQGIHFDEDESLLDSNGQEDFISSSGSTQRRILEFSSFADSCRRNVILGVEGTMAFNVTRNGQCFDINSSSGKGCSTLLLCILISLYAATINVVSTIFS